MFLLVLIVIAVIAALVYNFATAGPTSQSGTVSDLEPTDSMHNLIVPHGGVPYMMAQTGRTKVVGNDTTRRTSGRQSAPGWTMSNPWDSGIRRWS